MSVRAISHLFCLTNIHLSSSRIISGVLVQHGIKVTAESTGNFKSTLQKAYRSVAFLLNNFQLSVNEVCMRINRSKTSKI